MIGIVAITEKGTALALRLKSMLPNSSCYTLPKWQTEGCKTINQSLKEFCGELFTNHQSLIFIMASGIVVRSIAPWIKDKTVDPAVVVIDDNGNNVISLMSGHLGGANALTLKISELIAAHPVITTASDVNNLLSVDMLAQEYNLVIDSMDDAKTITALIVNNKNVELVDKFNIIDNNALPSLQSTCMGKIIVSNNSNIQCNVPYAKLIPKNIILGIGCKKDTDTSALIAFIGDTCKKYNIDTRSISTIASIDIKAEEKAIIEAAKYYNATTKFYNAGKLKLVDDLFQGSSFVKATVGVASVSTTAAFTAANKQGTFIVEKEAYKGMTVSIIMNEEIKV